MGGLIVETKWRDLPGTSRRSARPSTPALACWVNIEIKNAAAEPDFDPHDRVAVEVLADLAERGPGAGRG